MATASQTSGPAPLGVTFDVFRDATLPLPADNGSGDPDSSLFHYAWNFGDTAGGATWTHSGKSKNVDRSCQAAHVFETRGTYTVTLTIVTDAGVTTEYEQVITVTDPEEVYAGATYYADFTSGLDTNDGLTPGNAFKTSEKLFDTVFASNGPRRGLFKKGETFTVTTNKSYTTALTGPFHIGAYGSGANPIIAKSSANEIIALGSGMTAGARFVDIDLTLTSTATGFRPGSQCLYLRCTALNPASDFSTTSSTHGGKNETIIQECTVTGATGLHNIYWNFGYRSAILGCTLGHADSGSTPHEIRCYLTHSSIKHNFFGTGATGGSLMKFLGYVSGMADGQATNAVEYSVISDNVTDGTHPLGLAEYFTLKTENDAIDQRIQNCIIERNYIKAAACSSSQRLIIASGSYNTYRNNRFDGSAEPGCDGIHIVRSGVEQIPTGNQILHNSFYASDTMDPVIITNVPTSLSNGAFTGNANGWQLGTGYAYGSNNISVTLGSASDLTQLEADMSTTKLTIGFSYSVTFTLAVGWVGNITPKVGSTGVGTTRNAAGTYTETIVCAGSTDFILTKDAVANGTLDTVACQEQSQPVDNVVKNNHAMTTNGIGGGSDDAVVVTDSGTGTVKSGNTRSAVGFTDPGGATPDWTPTATILETVTVLAAATEDFALTSRGAIGSACDSASTEAA